ncbi:MAG: amidophosphoribosyltransferase [Deltaproteobacteria bacterium]|nr:amidophosphoribosyltransferase [Deltaproteobacteria bacterium]
MSKSCPGHPVGPKPLGREKAALGQKPGPGPLSPGPKLNSALLSPETWKTRPYSPHRWREECGVVGIWAPGLGHLADLCYLALFALQHRGQESAGISVTNGLHIETVKGMGLLTDAFRNGRPTLEGHASIGHVRYSTYGGSLNCNVQPIFAYSPGGFVGLAHNGNLTNAEEIKATMMAEGCLFQTKTDSEVILNHLARANREKVEEAIGSTLRQMTGSYSLVILLPDRLVGLRDPRGYRPLCLGQFPEGGYILASESCALDAVKANFIRDIQPGEMVTIDRDGLRSHFFDKAEKLSSCVFEYIYFARPDSVLDGLSVWKSRFEMGRELAKEFKGREADIVIPVPDTGITAALGFSKESGLPYLEGLIKNRYVGRSFIMPQQISRETTVEMKLNPVRANLEGQRVVLIDDSIVRGTTSARIVSLVRRAGAKEVHMCVSSPPITQSCNYGIDTSIRKELIASNMSVDQIGQSLGVDSLIYLSEKGLLKSVGDPDNKRNCLECFS